MTLNTKHLDDTFPRLHTTRYSMQIYIRASPLIPLISFPKLKFSKLLNSYWEQNQPWSPTVPTSQVFKYI